MKNEHEDVQDRPWTHMTIPSMNPRLSHARRYIYYIWHVSLILLMLVQNWNKFTYLGPSNLGIWAHQTKEKTGFVKLTVSKKTRKSTKNPKSFSGKILPDFSWENTFLGSKHSILIITNASKDRNNPKTTFRLKNYFSTVLKTQKNKQSRHAKIETHQTHSDWLLLHENRMMK